MFEIGRTTRRWFNAVILIGGGMMMALTGGWFTYDHFEFLQQSERSPGTVVEILRERGAGGMRLDYPLVQFLPQNADQEIVFRARPGLWPSPFEVGDPVVVAYETDDPAGAKIVSFWMLWFLPLVMIFFGGACVFAGRHTLREKR